VRLGPGGSASHDLTSFVGALANKLGIIRFAPSAVSLARAGSAATASSPEDALSADNEHDEHP
jgi:hypothetical protein